MSWREDYRDDHCDGFPDIEKEEKECCTYCGEEDGEVNPVITRKISTLGKHFKEKVCKACLAEMLKEEKETIIEEHVH